jgi:hypothetical protein
MGAPDSVTLHLIHDRLVRAVRAVDSRHIIIIEDGYKGPDSFPHLSLVGWNNVMLSWHHYNFNAKSAREQEQGLLRVATNASRRKEIVLHRFTWASSSLSRTALRQFGSRSQSLTTRRALLGRMELQNCHEGRKRRDVGLVSFDQASRFTGHLS